MAAFKGDALKITTRIFQNNLIESVLIDSEIINKINKLNNPPPTMLNAGDVLIRKCRLAGSLLDSYKGKFRESFLPELLQMVNGIPLLVGHQKNSAPIGRFFGGSIIKENIHLSDRLEQASFIEPFFYWPEGISYSRDLRILIDAGIYNEASLSFVYNRPSCSFCGKDIRGCPHAKNLWSDDPEYFFYYDDVKTVLEGSIVFRGAEPGTGFGL